MADGRRLRQTTGAVPRPPRTPRVSRGPALRTPPEGIERAAVITPDDLAALLARAPQPVRRYLRARERRDDE